MKEVDRKLDSGRALSNHTLFQGFSKDGMKIEELERRKSQMEQEGWRDKGNLIGVESHGGGTSMTDRSQRRQGQGTSCVWKRRWEREPG